jgi:hypothetical protein
MTWLWNRSKLSDYDLTMTKYYKNYDYNMITYGMGLDISTQTLQIKRFNKFKFLNKFNQTIFFYSFNWNSAVNKNIFQKNISNRARALYPKKSLVLGMGWVKIIFNENFYKKYSILPWVG